MEGIRNIIDFKHTIQIARFTHNEYKETWGIPIIKRIPISSSNNLGTIAFNNTQHPEISGTNKIVHFFISDRHFKSVYTTPDRHIQRLSLFSYVLSPDFSLYSDFPLIIQLANTYKNRWCGAFWQQLGMPIIPTVSWGSEESYDFCFKGIQKGAVVALSTTGCSQYKEDFLSGYQEMMRQIEPHYVLCFGKPFREMENNTIVINYQSYRQTKEDIWEEEEPKLDI